MNQVNKQPVAETEIKQEPKKPRAKEEPTEYRVARGGSFYQNGHNCTIPTGHLVKLAAYGKDAIARMKSCGIVLEAIET